MPIFVEVLGAVVTHLPAMRAYVFTDKALASTPDSLSGSASTVRGGQRRVPAPLGARLPDLLPARPGERRDADPLDGRRLGRPARSVLHREQAPPISGARPAVAATPSTRCCRARRFAERCRHLRRRRGGVQGRPWRWRRRRGPAIHGQSTRGCSRSPGRQRRGCAALAEQALPRVRHGLGGQRGGRRARLPAAARRKSAPARRAGGGDGAGGGRCWTTPRFRSQRRSLRKLYITLMDARDDAARLARTPAGGRAVVNTWTARRPGLERHARRA